MRDIALDAISGRPHPRRHCPHRDHAPVYVLSHPTELAVDTPAFEQREGLLFVGRPLEQSGPNWQGLLRFVWDVAPNTNGTTRYDPDSGGPSTLVSCGARGYWHPLGRSCGGFTPSLRRRAHVRGSVRFAAGVPDWSWVSGSRHKAHGASASMKVPIREARGGRSTITLNMSSRVVLAPFLVVKPGALRASDPVFTQVSPLRRSSQISPRRKGRIFPATRWSGWPLPRETDPHPHCPCSGDFGGAKDSLGDANHFWRPQIPAQTSPGWPLGLQPVPALPHD
jgi:hypothetical protein